MEKAVMAWNLAFVFAWLVLPSGLKMFSFAFLMPLALNLAHEAQVLMQTRRLGYGIVKIGLILAIMALSFGLLQSLS